MFGRGPGCERRAWSPPLGCGRRRRGRSARGEARPRSGGGAVSQGWGAVDGERCMHGRTGGADVKDTSPASAHGVGWGRGEGRAEGRSLQFGIRVGRGRRGGGKPCGSGARAHGSARAAAGGVAGREGGRWAHASPRAGEAHALGARGGRAHPGGVCATARAERVGCKTDLRNQG